MFKLYFLISGADVVASVTFNYQLIQNSLEFENLFFFNLKIKTRAQIRKNNIKKLVLYGHWRTRPIENSPTARFLHLGLVRQIDPYKTRSLIYYFI
jgi:hypothetical protein